MTASDLKDRIARLPPFVGWAVVAVFIAAVLAIRLFNHTAVTNPEPPIAKPSTASPGGSNELFSAYESVAKMAEAQFGKAATNTKSAAPSKNARTSDSPEATGKGEDEMSQAIANRAVGILRTMARVLGRALVEEEKGLAKPKAAAALATRPAWVDAAPKLVGDVYQTTAVVGPFTTRAECEAETPEALRESLDRYVEVAIGPEAVGMVALPSDYLRKNVVVEQWEETRSYKVGPMIHLHLRLQFDHRVKARVDEAYRQAFVMHRLGILGRWAGVVLGLVAVAFGYLKIDLVTRGVHRGRLRWAAATVILLLVVAAAA